MFSFFKKKKKIKIPEWADFFTATEYTNFIIEVENYFKGRNISYKIDNNIINVDQNSFGLGTLGLVNVAQVCKQDDERSYKEIVTDHFNTLRRAQKLSNDFDKIIDQFELIKEYIGVRLYHESFISQAGDKVVFTDFVADIKEVLVFDLPESVQTISTEQVKKWGIGIDELFHLGKQNIKLQYPLTVVEEHFNEHNIWFITDDHFYVPNIVFDLENRPDLNGKHGILIGMPHRHSVIIYPINTMGVVEAVKDLIPAIYKMNQEGPGSLSNALLWYNNYEFLELPYKLTDGNIQFYPPENFVEMLSFLA